jgi:N-methylhydantoinase B
MSARGYEEAVVPEIIRNALLMAAAEMKAVVVRTAYSTTWSEAGDLSCALLTPQGELAAQGEQDIPVHLGTMALSVQGCLEAMGGDIAPGDILMHNDPRVGNNHLPDFLLVRPIYLERELIAYAAVRAHFADVGGRSPGSMTTVATDTFQEGIRVPPLHLARDDELNEELVRLLLSNTRAPELVNGDLRAQVAGLRRGAERVRAIAAKYGGDVFLSSMDEVLRRSEALMRDRIRELPDGVYEFEDACDGDGLSDDLAWIRLRLEIRDSEIVVDFTRSDDESRGAINCPYAVTVSGTYFALKAFIDPSSPVNSGSYRPISVVTRAGSLTHASADAAVAGAAGETVNVLVDVVLGALSAAVPERAIAAGSGSALAGIYSGRRRARGGGGRGFYVEPHGSAWGARAGSDGRSGRRVGTGNAGNQPTEVIETTFPLRVREYALAQDAGGAGRHRGGLPIRRVIEICDEFILTVTGERVKRSPHGVLGGMHGRSADLRINPDTPEEQVLPSKTPPIALKAGDVVRLQGAGGGGFGDPRERALAAITGDILDGYVSLDAAAELYGRRREELQRALDEAARSTPPAARVE